MVQMGRNIDDTNVVFVRVDRKYFVEIFAKRRLAFRTKIFARFSEESQEKF
jgi:hypothetical protein